MGSPLNTPQTEEGFWALLAERPDDRSLRLVFSDWLQEQGDPRGEAIALWANGTPSPVARRRAHRLAQRHAKAWLGPSLFDAVDLPRCEFEGGFPRQLWLRPDVFQQFWDWLTPEPRLCTVRRLLLHRLTLHGPRGFLAQPALSHLDELVVPLTVARALEGQRIAPERLARVGLFATDTFDDELAALDGVEALAKPAHLELWSANLVGAEFVRDLWRSLKVQRRVLERRRELTLGVENGTLEGVAAWLTPVRGREWIDETWRPDALSARVGDVKWRLGRDARDHLGALVVDADSPRGAEGLGARISAIGAVLAQLKAAELSSIELVLPHGARLKAAERDELRAAARRLRTVTHFAVQGEAVSP